MSGVPAAAHGESLQVCRLILDPPATGVWNMAADEYLLRTTAAAGAPTLRLYRWSTPTLSLGYFQRFEACAEHPPSQGCPIVRRASGGGAIVHDHEWTYSLCLPISRRWSSDAWQLYAVVHQTFVKLLADWGVASRLCTESTAAGREAPFLCFRRRAEGDLLVGEHKVAGSAQRRHHGAMLQHGSVLLATSAAAPELPGIFDLGGTPSRGGDAFLAWPTRLAQALGWSLERSDWTNQERDVIEFGEVNKFGNERWLRRR